MTNDPDLEPAPDYYRNLFTGQALGHLDEMVMSWRMAGHPISWQNEKAVFEVSRESGHVEVFSIVAPDTGTTAGIEFDLRVAAMSGIPPDFVDRIADELTSIGGLQNREQIQIRVSLGKFSRGDRKVFMAYTLTAARFLAFND